MKNKLAWKKHARIKEQKQSTWNDPDLKGKKPFYSRKTGVAFFLLRENLGNICVISPKREQSVAFFILRRKLGNIFDTESRNRAVFDTV